MKINRNILSGFIFTVFLTVNSTMADTIVNSGKLSFDFSGAVSGLVKSTNEAVGNVFNKNLEQKEESISQEIKLINSDEKKNPQEKIILNSCEVYGLTFLNSLKLDLESTEAQTKIDKIQDTIDEEIALRENIFSNDNAKSLNILQKKEKVIFSEMKKDLDEAKKYYSNLDEKVLEVSDFLVNIDCENLKTKIEKDLRDNLADTEDLLGEEMTFRKEFSMSLKDQMSVIKKEVKEVKK